MNTNTQGQLHTYETVSEFVRAAGKPYDEADTAWFGGLTPGQCQQAAIDGHNEAVAGAERFLASLESKLTLPDTYGYQTIRSPFGGRVDIGDWNAGSPTPMRRRVRRANDVSPVKIVVGSFVSSGISADTLKRRREAILAFLMLAQTIRPVELYVLGESTHTAYEGWRNFLIRLESRPLSLSQAGFVIGHPGFFRALGNAWFIKQNPTAPSVPLLHSTPAEQRERLGLTESDVLIEKAAWGDTLLSDPLAWIERELAKMCQ